MRGPSAAGLRTRGPRCATIGRVEDFLIARNPDGDSSLPYLLRIPLGANGFVLKARDTWPRTAKIFCHREAWWPSDAEIVERVPVRSCVRRGAAIDLVLDRSRENRSQFVLTRIRGGREAIFWQSARTAKLARPNVSLPSARAHGCGPTSSRSSSTATSATHGSSPNSRSRPGSHPWPRATTASATMSAWWPLWSASPSRTSCPR